MSSDSLAAALATLQTRLPKVEKDKTAKVETQKGPGYSYSYADLSSISAQILPMLGELGLSFICKPTFVDGRFVLAYSLLHTSGQREDGQYPLPSGGTPQALGSAITYGRRYCLCAVTGIAPEDDDDASAAQAEAAGNRGVAQRASRPAAGRPVGASAQRALAATTAPPLPGEDSGLITKPQMGRMQALFAERGIADREEKLAYARKVIGREIGSATELTVDEARLVIDELELPDDTGRGGEGDA